MNSQVGATLLLVWCALRAGEMVLSVTNSLRLLNEGAMEYCRSQHPWLIATTGTAGLLAYSALIRPAEVSTSLQAFAQVLFVMCESLHVWAIATLGRRWTTGVVVLAGEVPVRRGPYRWLSHPGYLGGATAAALLPLAAGSWRLALMAGVLLAVVVWRRVRCENAAWLTCAGPAI